MSRRAKSVLLGYVAVILILGFALKVDAAKPQPLSPHPYAEQMDEFVETQGFIRNTTGCYWDPDDHIELTFFGDYLAPGQSASYSHCYIGDSGWDFGLSQAGTGLTLELSFGFASVSTTGDRVCLAGPVYRDEDPARVPVGEGTGVPGTVTWTVRNDTDRTVRFGRRESVQGGSGLMGYEPTDDHFCPSGFYIVQTGEGGWPQGGPGVWWSK